MTEYDYDAIVIGAGIGGLVCGCYLAKAGMKVLIVEKNAQPGGYCTSFTRNGFRFDACAHSLGSLRRNGILRIVLEELELERKVATIRSDPQDIIITPEKKISFWNDLDKTIDELQREFPQEAPNIKHFFDFLNNCTGFEFSSLIKVTFQTLLDKYFKDERLKSILAYPIFGNAGLPASKLSSIVAVTLYKEVMLDGGYYPEGGMQTLHNVILAKFKEYGGKILTSSLVTKIKVKNNCVEGLEVNRSNFISSKYTVSNADAKQTFLDLLGKRYLSKDFSVMLDNLKPSLSMLVLYLGTKPDSCNALGDSNIWFLADYNIERLYDIVSAGNIEDSNWFLLHRLLDRKSLIVFVNASFKNNNYWRKNKQRLIDIFVNKIQCLIPNLSKEIVFKDAATPNTLYEWTLNHCGAAYGWEGTPAQLAIPGMAKTTPINNLFLAGHWTTLALGVSGAAYVGRDVAGMILYKAGQ